MNINEFKKLSTIKPKNDPNAWMDEPIKAEKWRNLWFLKDGRSRLGKTEYPTQSAAEEGVKSVDDIHYGLTWPNTGYFTQEGGSYMPLRYVSHAIQIPVKS